jgi:hypothetical protein
MDPLDFLGYRDRTIDFHMTDMSLWSVGTDDFFDNFGKPTNFGGIDLGWRAICGEALEILMEEGWGERVNARSVGELQEVLWGWWIIGKESGLWGDLQTATLKL